MKQAILIFLLFTSLNSLNLKKDDINMFMFMKFIKENNKNYFSVEEFNLRFSIFESNLLRMQNTKNYDVKEDEEKLSPFMDITKEEFKKLQKLNYSAVPRVKAVSKKYIIKTPSSNLPISFDWRAKNAVTGVKDQGECGSCWAFSAIGNIESLYAIKNKKQEVLSEQLLIDCDTEDQGCDGGLMDNAFDWLLRAGLERSSDYPYKGKVGECVISGSKYVARISDYLDISDNEEEIRAALFENGPLSIAVDATDFQVYTKGIKTTCEYSGLNHGVLLVGYGVENGINYWIIKNSWGTSWGENGYIRLQRGLGLCGMNIMVSTSVLSDD